MEIKITRRLFCVYSENGWYDFTRLFTTRCRRDPYMRNSRLDDSIFTGIISIGHAQSYASRFAFWKRVCYHAYKTHHHFVPLSETSKLRNPARTCDLRLGPRLLSKRLDQPKLKRKILGTILPMVWLSRTL